MNKVNLVRAVLRPAQLRCSLWLPYGSRCNPTAPCSRRRCLHRGDPIRTAQVCRSLADPENPRGFPTPLVIPTVNTVTDRKPKTVILGTIGLSPCFPEHNAQEKSRQSTPSRIRRKKLFPRSDSLPSPSPLVRMRDSMAVKSGGIPIIGWTIIVPNVFASHGWTCTRGHGGVRPLCV